MQRVVHFFNQVSKVNWVPWLLTNVTGHPNLEVQPTAKDGETVVKRKQDSSTAS